MRVGCRRLRKKPAHTEASKQSTDSRQAPACSPLEDDQIVAECKVRVQKLRENLLKQNHILQSEVSVQERFDASCSLFDASDHSLNLQSVKSSWLRSRDKPCDTNEGLEGSDASDTCSESDTSDSDSSGTGVEGAENLSAIVEDEEVAEETVEEGSDDEEEGDEVVEEGNEESTPAGDDSRNCVSVTETRRSESLEGGSLEVLTPSRRKTGEEVVEEPSPRDRVLEQCGQDAPLPFTSVIPPSVMKKCVKIGEGVYGEVFRTTRSGNSVALKIIPIEGDFEVNDEPQKTFTEILPEIVISNELSGLRNGTENSTYNFCPVRSVSCVQGCYPPELLKQWDVFHEKKTSENDRPDIFGLEQLYILFEFGDGGCDLESCKLKSAAEGVSVLQQVACALAVAEEEMKFEHRDLHVGNVLVQPTDETTVTVTLNGTPVFIDTHGVQVNIIDFTLSRLTKDGCTVFCDLASDDSLFEGKGDYQFDIYRMMKKENKNHWEAFHPHTNVMWLHYLCDKLINRKRYSANDRSHREAMKRLRQALQNLLQYQSAAHFVLEDALFDS
ncbi:hypothetical protein BaRGS_00012426 [Batillaria attramentaria]|uniref:non-specific serine/threonine protein kinase n=1 Tax=Batillaria attramentaria TaxID=370345 RepID=A0ABD0LAE1_9CAEN